MSEVGLTPEEYYFLIEDTISGLTEETRKAAKRNERKDLRTYHRYGDDFDPEYHVKGWNGFDLTAKLKEEFQEFLSDPSAQEAGDLAWTIAMILEQRKPTGDESVEGKKPT